MTSRTRFTGLLALAIIAGLALVSTGLDRAGAGGTGGGGIGGGGGVGGIGAGGSGEIDPQNQVGAIVAGAKERMGSCGSPNLPELDQIECVGRALDQVADALLRTPGMRRAQRIFRSTARAVRQSSTTTQAVAAIEEGRHELLSSDGAGRAQAEELAEVMDTARSVLRS